MYSIWLTSSEHDREIYNLIQRFADEEGQDAFIPHVTLVTQISTQEKAAEILNQIFKNKCSVLFDQISVGNTYFQKLFLESSDNSCFFKAISNIQGWPSLWYLIYRCTMGMSYPNLLTWGSSINSSL